MFLAIGRMNSERPELTEGGKGQHSLGLHRGTRTGGEEGTRRGREEGGMGEGGGGRGRRRWAGGTDRWGVREREIEGMVRKKDGEWRQGGGDRERGTHEGYTYTGGDRDREGGDRS